MARISAALPAGAPGVAADLGSQCSAEAALRRGCECRCWPGGEEFVCGSLQRCGLGPSLPLLKSLVLFGPKPPPGPQWHPYLNWAQVSDCSQEAALSSGFISGLAGVHLGLRWARVFPVYVCNPRGSPLTTFLASLHACAFICLVMCMHCGSLLY